MSGADYSYPRLQEDHQRLASEAKAGPLSRMINHGINAPKFKNNAEDLLTDVQVISCFYPYVH
jgi:hypothetical protein